MSNLSEFDYPRKPLEMFKFKERSCRSALSLLLPT
jgi:hypothetical protein